MIQRSQDFHYILNEVFMKHKANGTSSEVLLLNICKSLNTLPIWITPDRVLEPAASCLLPAMDTLLVKDVSDQGDMITKR